MCLFGSPFWTRPTLGTKSVKYFKGNLEQTSSLVKHTCCLCLGFDVLQPHAPHRACARTSCSSAMSLPGLGRGSVTPAAAGQLDVRSRCLRARFPWLRPLGALVRGAAQPAYVVTEAHSTEVFQSHLLVTPRQTKKSWHKPLCSLLPWFPCHHQVVFGVWTEVRETSWILIPRAFFPQGYRGPIRSESKHFATPSSPSN